MPRILRILVLATAAVAAITPPALAQTAPPQVVEVKLRDGSLLFGTIVSNERDRLVIKTISGADVTVNRDQVESVQQTAGTSVGGEFWTDDVIGSKLFLGPTGRSLKRGEGYLAIDSLILPVFQVGVTDRFSIGMGAPFYGFLKSAWITPKFQIYRDDKTAISTGVLHLFVPDFGLGGFGYVVATRGSSNASVTFGGGMLYGRDDGQGAALPMFTIGGERRLGRRTKFVTENYIVGAAVISTVGTRIIGQSVSAEIGAIVMISDEGALPGGIFFNFIFHPRPRASQK